MEIHTWIEYSRSRAYDRADANALIKALGWDKYFQMNDRAIDRNGGKKNHFNRLQQKTGIPYNRMLFFDDRDKNIQDIESIGKLSNNISILNFNAYGSLAVCEVLLASNLIIDMASPKKRLEKV